MDHIHKAKAEQNRTKVLADQMEARRAANKAARARRAERVAEKRSAILAVEVSLSYSSSSVRATRADSPSYSPPLGRGRDPRVDLYAKLRQFFGFWNLVASKHFAN
jgi:hypothetical protein